MKLGAKINLLFCTTMAIILLVVGIVSSYVATDSSMSIVDDSMTTSATLAANQIYQQFKDYSTAVTFLGRDQILINDQIPTETKLAYLDAYIQAYGFTSGNILDTKGVSIEDGTDFSDRAYVQQALKGETTLSEVTLSKLTGNYGISIAAPIVSSEGTINGVVYFRLDIDFIENILSANEVSKHSYSYLVDGEGNIIVHPNKDLILNYNMTKHGKNMKEIATNVADLKSGNGSYTYKGEEILCGYSPIGETGEWGVVIAAPKTDFTKASERIRNSILVMAAIAILIVIAVSTAISMSISRPLNKVKNALISVSKGDFNVKIKKKSGHDEVTILNNTTVELIETLDGIMADANKILGSIARYDLTSDDMKNYPGAFNNLAESVNSIKSTLNQLIIEIQHAVRNVDTGSRELAQATATLSQGTVSQASSIQTLADDLGIVTDRINRNSERADQVNSNLSNLDTQIQTVGKRMEDLMKAVDNIETMSSSIQKIVGTIDGIAFQTNILSLNASVEAARAGDLGSGFAVVADEVRSLAEKCSESSKRTSDLINECIAYINNAKKCADSTFESLSAIVKDSADIASTFEEISTDTTEQANKSNHIQEEVTIISNVVQTNSATVEETAAATAVLSEQAANLEDMIRSFQVK